MSQTARQIQLRLSWGKCTNDRWCELNSVDLQHPTFAQGGVYVVWHGGQSPRVVYVGQTSVLRDRLVAHRSDRRIQAFSRSALYVTWASVETAKRDGVEVGLAARYAPLVGDRHPDARPIEVNSPWD